jgi:circadian clock protein KaiC
MTSSNGFVSTGIAGMDDVLQGGWPQGRMYLIEGFPGTGKTTVGLQFLLEGAARGEPVLYISLSESKGEIEHVVRSHGWALDGVSLFELDAARKALGLEDQQTMFDPSDVEFRETNRLIVEEVERVAPTRVVFDSLSELALLARDPLAFRREVLMLKRVFADNSATVLLLSDATSPEECDRQLHSLAHGVLKLEALAPDYGADRRRLLVVKLRGTKFRAGYHDYRIDTGGVQVYPRLVASEHHQHYPKTPLVSDIPALDSLLGGGLARGSSTLLMGPAGSGKSSLLAQFAFAALSRGEAAVICLFDEGKESFLLRSAALGLPLDEYVTNGKLVLRQIDPAEMTPGEFVHLIRAAVEGHGAQFVGIDSLNGYIYAMPEERFLTLHVHELLAYLNQRGVATLMLLTQHGLLGAVSTPADVTYVADALILLRFFEDHGRLNRAISVLKKRHSAHENTIRRLAFEGSRITVGDSLDHLKGVLSGLPTFVHPMVSAFPQSGDATL